MRKQEAFTLIELLVVISIIALLMAILIPTIQRAKRQAKTVKCQANLHQLGLAVNAYAAANEGSLLPVRMSVQTKNYAGFVYHWTYLLRSYCIDINDVLLCPMTKYYPNRPGPVFPRDCQWYIPLKWSFEALPLPMQLSTPYLHGSYGFNCWLETPESIGRYSRTHPYRTYIWTTSNLKDAVNVPVFLDCRFEYVHTDLPAGSGKDGISPPPLFEGDWTIGRRFEAATICLDRHNGGINSLFMDGSVRKVGLKELWTLKWHRQYNIANRWTKAGGIQPSDWPQWMRKFKDY